LHIVCRAGVMASSLNKMMDALMKQAKGGSGKAGKEGGSGASAALPPWIYEGACLAYHSERSEQTLDVVVDCVDQAKQQVKFAFESDRKVWKSVTFSQIVCGTNPLRPRAKAPRLRSKEGGKDASKVDDGDSDDDDPDAFLKKMEDKFGDAPAKKKAHRSGPSGNKLPKQWQQPEVVSIVDQPGVVDLDSSPEREPPPPEDKDPYGLEGLGLEKVNAPVGKVAKEALRGSRSRSAKGRGPAKEKAAKERAAKAPRSTSRSRSAAQAKAKAKRGRSRSRSRGAADDRAGGRRGRRELSRSRERERRKMPSRSRSREASEDRQRRRR